MGHKNGKGRTERGSGRSTSGRSFVSATSIAVRVAGRADLAALDRLYRRSYLRLLSADYPPSTLVLAVPRFGRAQPRLLASGRFYVATDADGGLMAFAAISDVWTAPGGRRLAQVATVTCEPNVDVKPIHHRMGVILSRAGQLETLRLDKDAPSRAPVETARPAAEATASPNASAVLSTIREELLNDPSRANQYIRMQPSSSGGQLRGYRIYPGRDRAVFNAAGLRPGDLVTEVNGIQLNDASTALQMLGQLSSATSLTVVVERGGQPQTVNVNFN